MFKEKKAPKQEKNEKEDIKDIEIITGNGKGLDISPAYDHIKMDKPTPTSNKNNKIVVPKSKNNK